MTPFRRKPPPGAYFREVGGAAPFFAAPSSPAAALPPPSSLTTERFEAHAETVVYGESSETLIYSTRKPWRGIDVYIEPPPLSLHDTVLTVRVYANVLGVRTLVASGRLGNAVVGGMNIPAKSSRIVAARCLAESFEVTLFAARSAVNLPPAPDLRRCRVAVLASDQVDEPPAELGGVLLGPLISNAAPPTLPATVATILDTGTGHWPEAELLWVEGAPGTAVGATPRYLLVYDQLDSVGVQPIPAMTFSLGDLNASTVRIPVGIRTRSGRWQIRASSTPLTLTPVTDCALQAMVR
ncbi:MAG: hypothetical protein WKG32_20920 [Gemmatimonadaceae bacterium]